ncbi:MAG: gliding motility-associated C-terminal domain-containing protein [Prolixibacteraceae bacterium]|jgi:hypothetical protein
MTRFIFIFSIILVHFLTIVSKNGFCAISTFPNNAAKIETFANIDSVFTEDFESGDISYWKQTNDWEVSAENCIAGIYSLRHSGKATSGSSSIFHSFSSDLNSDNLQWSFKIKNGNWDPSSSNKFWFNLCADTIQTDLINGFAVGVNISGSSDLLELWRIGKGKADSLIIRTDFDWDASTQLALTVKRTSRGDWTLNYQKTNETISPDFSGTDRTIFNFKNIGLLFNFTSTRVGQLWIDDILIVKQAGELFIQEIKLIDSHSVSVIFNKPINPASILSGNFKLTDENNQEIRITQVAATTDSDRAVDVKFGNVQGIELTLKVSGILDLTGKPMIPEIRSFSFSFSPEVGSVLINEILFNPFSEGVDFVELVNVSGHIIPVLSLKLATRNDTLALKQIYPISIEKKYLKPGEFLVCTKDPAIVSVQYFSHNPESFCVMKTLPSFPDDAGTVVLLNDSLEVLDEFSYSAKMHSPFLADENGVSLERISLEKPTSDLNNWASSAASVGYATPGLPNSQLESQPGDQDEITPEPKAFSPNSDGYNDELTIKFKLSKSGYIANVRIFDVVGRQVRFLVKNQSLAHEGSWLWNGESDNGQKLSIGVYIILVEVFDQEGHNKVFKKTCTLTDRME